MTASTASVMARPPSTSPVYQAQPTISAGSARSILSHTATFFVARIALIDIAFSPGLGRLAAIGFKRTDTLFV